MKNRVAEERSSFLRLGITPSGQDASDSRIDFDSDKGVFVLRKNPGNF
ncbi:hypothetical protein HYU14_02765 [Candidatus Woesearchaeota archaeon]|nr:hypothetical protein [Candidatus Woesearchaeota archaeon]